MFKNEKLYKKGYTLIELLLALGISAILIITLFIVYSKTAEEKSANAEITKIKTISAGIESLYASKSTYDGITIPALIQAEIFPDNMLVKEGEDTYNVVNGFGGPVDVATSGYWKDDSYMIRYFRVPGSSCFKLPIALDQMFDVINLGAQSVKHPSKNEGQLDKSLLFDLCKSAEEGKFTYEIQFVR